MQKANAAGRVLDVITYDRSLLTEVMHPHNDEPAVFVLIFPLSDQGQQRSDLLMSYKTEL